jgi:hypothetical protein
MCTALDVLYPGLPGLPSIQEVIKHFATKSDESIDLVVANIKKYLQDRFFHLEKGCIVHPNEEKIRRMIIEVRREKQ